MALFPSVGGHDLREVALGGLKVVVVAVNTSLGQAIHLFLRQNAHRCGHINVNLCLNGGDGLFHLAEQSLIRPLYCSNDAELSRTRLCGLLGGVHQGRDIQPCRTHRGLEQTRLRTEVAILWAAASLQRDNAFNLDLFAAPLQAHLMSQRQQILDAVVVEVENRQGLLVVQPLSADEHLFAGEFQNVLLLLSHGGATLLEAGDKT